jgi:hypothetical protein
VPSVPPTWSQSHWKFFWERKKIERTIGHYTFYHRYKRNHIVASQWARLQTTFYDRRATKLLLLLLFSDRRRKNSNGLYNNQYISKVVSIRTQTKKESRKVAGARPLSYLDTAISLHSLTGRSSRTFEMNFCFYPPPGKANVHSGNPLEPSASLYSRVHFFTDVRQKAARQKGDKKEFLYGHVITISYTHTHTHPCWAIQHRGPQ